MENNKIEMISMQMILHAGDARNHIMTALEHMANFDFVAANTSLVDAQEELRIAHQSQTNLIQGEARGEKQEYSILFAHAQDTFMSVYSELTLTKKMMIVFQKLDSRMNAMIGDVSHE